MSSEQSGGCTNACPPGYTSIAGSTTLQDCYPEFGLRRKKGTVMEGENVGWCAGAVDSRTFKGEDIDNCPWKNRFYSYAHS